LRELRKEGVYTYHKLDEASEVSKFHIVSDRDVPGSGFNFFVGMGITDYGRTFKMWLREFPRPVFVIAAKGNQVVSWVYVQEWGELSREGAPIYVLRAIETLPSIRKQKIGMKLLLLVLNETVGYMITKPLTKEAERFFKRAGFMAEEEFRRCPVELSQHHGYLVMPPFRKKKLLDEWTMFFQSCK